MRERERESMAKQEGKKVRHCAKQQDHFHLSFLPLFLFYRLLRTDSRQFARLRRGNVQAHLRGNSGSRREMSRLGSSTGGGAIVKAEQRNSRTINPIGEAPRLKTLKPRRGEAGQEDGKKRERQSERQ